MNADYGLIDIGNSVDQVFDALAHVCRRCVTNSVGDVNGGGSRLDNRLHDAAQEIRLGSGGIFRRKFNVVAIALGAFYSFDRTSDDFVGTHVEFKLAMDRTGRQENMDSRIRRLF